MAAPSETTSMALFCDFENVALGVRDAKYEKFDIKLVLERLLLKGSIVVKKAYCDWERYKGFKATMHEANFELIEIPHVRQSGKNSADIRLVVDALDLCYTKSHVNTFVIISGDSDFSPLVSKLRENAKQVIGVGVKQSTSDLLIANCDEFIFYDDLVRETQRAAARREPKDAQPARRADDDKPRREDVDARRTKGIEIAVQTFDALIAEKGDTGKIWASVLKEAIKRRKPDFSETRYGFRSFGALLEEAHGRGLLEFGRDEKSGAYVYRSSSSRVEPPLPESPPAIEVVEVVVPAPAEATRVETKPEGRRKRTGGKKAARPQPEMVQVAEPAAPVVETVPAVEAIAPEPAPRRARNPRTPIAEAVAQPAEEAPAKPKRSRRKPAVDAVLPPVVEASAATADEAPAGDIAKPTRRRRARKSEA
ncbi:NYN domain-containing protein [Zoogloea sp.]|uniref:NYN domain-containing protein n=1 Tax=Zoogloea sp. TaxID=49181 RepID=UPI0035B1E3C6